MKFSDNSGNGPGAAAPPFNEATFGAAMAELKKATDEKSIQKGQSAIAAALWHSHIDPAIMRDEKIDTINAGAFTVVRKTKNGKSHWEPA